MSKKNDSIRLTIERSIFIYFLIYIYIYINIYIYIYQKVNKNKYIKMITNFDSASHL